jgi:hypothetical protein
VNFLVNRIRSKDSTIQDLNNAVLTSQQLVDTLKLDKNNLAMQRDLQREDMLFFRDLYKKSQTGKWLTSGLGIIVVIASYFIFSK